MLERCAARQPTRGLCTREAQRPPEGILPDIIVDERQMVSDRRHICVGMPDGWGDIRVLRLGIATPNVGLGDLRLEGSNVEDCDTSNDRVEQWIALDQEQSSFRRRALPPASIEHHPAHNHFHLRNWPRFRLVKPTPGVCDRVNSRPQSCVVRESEKLSFCIRDTQTFDREIGPPDRRFTDCELQADGLVHMGIQRGWSDVYDSGLFGQLIETTGLSGTYRLEAEANLDGAIEEEDRTNNVVRVPVTFSTPQACVRTTSSWQCGASASACKNLDCRSVSPDCCPCSGPGGRCQSGDEFSPCGRCKDYFSLQDPNSVACLGVCGTCPADAECSQG
ncbi:MAG: lysyl oxidase family protein [Candidatus Binatia bacterium]|nr:lysyl oxidase family protein [Candidatus Binatia bacterium]